jgi:hypothetical protein
MSQVVVTLTPPPTVIVGSNGITVVSVGTQGPTGATGPSGSTAPPVNFSFGDASPLVISTGQPAQVILQVTVNITEAFNGAGATLSVGTPANPSLYVTSRQVDLETEAEFEVTVGKSIFANTNIIATITPGTGATTGAGWVLIDRVAV